MYSISQVSRALCVSTRALRYWEQMGLIQSVKQPENGYRTYDRAAIQRAEQIAVLRRLADRGDPGRARRTARHRRG